jgi:hypothetical protein
MGPLKLKGWREGGREGGREGVCVCGREREKETEYCANNSGEYQGFDFFDQGSKVRALLKVLQYSVCLVFNRDDAATMNPPAQSASYNVE